MKDRSRPGPAAAVFELHPSRLLGLIQSVRMVRTVLLFSSVASTNDAAMKYHGGEGALFVAEEQTAGRGRKGRSWRSTVGKSLVVSLVLEPGRAREGLTVLVSLGIARALEGIVPGIGIKWPNDLLVGQRKICGILAEARGDRVVIGIGCNVNEDSRDFPPEIAGGATSLRIASGSYRDRGKILAMIVESFGEVYVRWREEGFAPFRDEVERRLVFTGENVTIDTGSELVGGILRGVTGEGFLRLGTGTEERIFVSGDVTVRREGREPDTGARQG